MSRPWAAAAALAAAVLAAFWPALGAGLVWDDRELLAHQGFRGLGWPNLVWMLGVHHANWVPLTWLSWAVDYQLWGLAPFALHLENVLFHAANAGLLMMIARRLLGSPTAAFWAALFFAIHPLRVESVAWACERRDVLSGFFFLASAWAYLESRRWLSVACYGLSLMAKPAGLPLPAVLLLLDHYWLERTKTSGWRAIIREKAPYLALAALAAGITLSGHWRSGNLAPLAEHGAGARLAQSLHGLAFYVSKTLWPWGLSPLHALPDGLGLGDARAWRAVLFLAAAALGLSLAVGDAKARRLLWGSYAVMILPVLGFFHNGVQIAAERYSYLSCLGFALAAGAAAARARSWALPLAAAAALGALTWRQCGFWRDEASLWTRAVSVEPWSPHARLNLGRALVETGNWEAALPHLTAASQHRSSRVLALLQLGYVSLRQGLPDEALRLFDAAVQGDPNYALSHHYLGVALAQRGLLPQAAEAFEKALSLDPTLELARKNLEAVRAAVFEAKTPRPRSR